MSSPLDPFLGGPRAACLSMEMTIRRGMHTYAGPLGVPALGEADDRGRGRLLR